MFEQRYYIPSNGISLAQIGKTRLTSFVEALFGHMPSVAAAVQAAYLVGHDGLNTPYDVISQIYGDYNFQCVRSR
jgi:hypothetical protein